MLKTASLNRLVVEKYDDAINCRLRTPELAFPDSHHVPAQRSELIALSRIAVNGRTPLRSPKFRVGRRSHVSPFAVMRMPKAAIHKYDRPPTGKHQVRSAGQGLQVQLESKSTCVKHSSEDHLRLRVGGGDPCHVVPALRGRKNIDHGSNLLRIRLIRAAMRKFCVAHPEQGCLGCFARIRAASLVGPAISSRWQKTWPTTLDEDTQWR